ncbi:23s rrna-intervening sequence protein [Lucifera butyrica]|uniref:23s rrna-intervening sequence protein n=1 Tax=Lucifera butyrica TaxID=1351585 RepID=A0A498RGQ5_9FIRM|nr:four helix bundle protein [Lucifera butyrica]VBB09283.1 23s rrna-intervening sequence protein [Lucifera butyrica]
MSEQQGFKSLRVWQDAMDLAVAVFKMSEEFPKQDFYGISMQIRRSSISVPSNIAEGWGRNRDKEFYYFLDIAHGSLCELETQLELAKRCYNIDIEKVLLQCEAVRKQIRSLRKKLNEKA